MTRIAIALTLACIGAACAAPSRAPFDQPRRAELLGCVKALEGTWESPGPDGQKQVIEFKVSSAGTVVRELMFPGTSEEMTNVYRLDGNELALTHYCAMGNQPELRASARIGKQLVFNLVGVADMDGPDEMYMGGLMLEFVDQDHLNEHWLSFAKGELQKDQSVDIALTRRK